MYWKRHSRVASKRRPPTVPPTRETGMATPRDSETKSDEHGMLAGYQRSSTRPLASLLFVAPLLLVYEAGVIWLGPEAMRNGADVWLRWILESAGFGQYLLLPIVTCCLLLGWHHLAHQPWRVKPRVLQGMLLESAALAVLLLAFAQLQGTLLQPTASVASTATAENHSALAGRLVSYCGAGIYEELLFRLMLLPAVAGLAYWLGAKPKLCWAIAIFATSVAFSAAHYDFVTPYGEPFALATFSFRLIAGGFFAVLFVYRGFGIAVGTHAFYDLLVALL